MAEIKQSKTLVQEFVESIVSIPEQLIDAALKMAVDEDEKAVISAFGPTLINQFREVSAHLNDISLTASKQRLMEAEQFLKLSSGVSLVNNFKLALPSIGSIIGKLGIDGIIKEIKKIIKFLLEMFHIGLPTWIDSLINLIDEIIADILGGGVIKFKTALSQSEQNYLGELTQLAKLQKATRDLSDMEDED